jgi:PPOX class probable F420-dependent enzyme
MVKSVSPGPTEISPRIKGSNLATTLDPNLVAFAATRNIGALATIQRDGRPQLSSVNFTLHPATAIARISVIDDRVVVHNMRRDPRASVFVASPDGWTYAVLEGTVELSPVAMSPDDDTVEELVDVFRTILGEDHPDWDGYRADMVADRRLVARLRVQYTYGLLRPENAKADYARPA